MIIKELENIVIAEKEKIRNTGYIKNALKEYLQVYLLFFIYTSPTYSKKLIFTGGTCLRHFYGLERLSEDIDFDCDGDVNTKTLANDVCDFFQKKYKYYELNVSLKQKDRQILFKFPVLKRLGLAGKNESDFLYVKLDVSEIPSKNYKLVASSQSKYGFNYVAKHYDLPDLMAGKIHAILRRRILKGKDDRESLKGRDYFDFLWFIKRGVKPNLLRLSDMLSENLTATELEAKLDQKVKNLEKHFNDFRSDIEPLVSNPEVVKLYIENYKEEYFRDKKLSL